MELTCVPPSDIVELVIPNSPFTAHNKSTREKEENRAYPCFKKNGEW